MPTHQGFESRLITAADVVRQQLPIGQPGAIPQKHGPAKALDDPTHLAGRHVLSFTAGDGRPLPYYYPQAAV